MSDIKIVGIGWEGNHYLEALLKNLSTEIKTISINTCNWILEKCTSQIKINIAKGEEYALDGGSPHRSERLAVLSYFSLTQRKVKKETCPLKSRPATCADGRTSLCAPP